MMESVGVNVEDLAFVLTSHDHEDHDGGLAELVRSTNLRIKAHAIYKLLIRNNPQKAPPGYKQNSTAKFWHCPVPESFSRYFRLHDERDRKLSDELRGNPYPERDGQLRAYFFTILLPKLHNK